MGSKWLGAAVGSMARWVVVALGMLLLLAGCGGSFPEPDYQPAELRFTATDGDQYLRFLLPIDDVEVTSAGDPVPHEVVVNQLDLAVTDHSPLVAKLLLLPGQETVHFTVRFQEYGLYDQLRSSRVFRTSAPLQFDAKVSDLMLHRHAVVELNLERSLVDTGGELVLLPNLNVRF